MAITIRNKVTEEMIRRIGKRRKEGPSAVVRRLARKEIAEEGQVSEQEFERRMQAFADLNRRFPPPEPKPSWGEVEAEMQSLFDYLDDEPVSVQPSE